MLHGKKPACKNLVLDAGPLLSLSPLRGLAETFLTVPQVLAELKDKRAREHFEKLGLIAGVHVEVRSPDAAALAHVIAFAKKTGDYSVLSHADLCVLALTYALGQAADTKGDAATESTGSQAPASAVSERAADSLSGSNVFSSQATVTIESDDSESEKIQEAAESPPLAEKDSEEEPLDIVLERVHDSPGETPSSHQDAVPESSSPATPDQPKQLYEDPSDDDDGEGEWITPSNVGLHKSQALELLPSTSARGRGNMAETIYAGCMTADFAMQNVLIQMGLNLVNTDGKKIERIKTWVLRCHACFKICRDSSKQFCPSCGNPTLLRAAVTVSSPNATGDAPAMQVHLKKNFQYRTRGTKYSIPSPQPGSSKKGLGEGLILREDQQTYMRAKKQEDGRRDREEKKMVSGALASNGDGGMKIGSWMDPDWIPEIIAVGAGGKGRTIGGGGLPQIGYGKKNPNEKRRRK